MTDETWTVHHTPLGELTLIAGPAGLTGLRFPGGPPLPAAEHRSDRHLAAAAGQLDEYFAGEREAFELDLDLRGTPFQLAVWEQLRGIPYGATVTYGAIARAIGRPERSRAVGAAVGRTPIPIVVPCHRVVGSDGALTGYGGGLPRKRALLDLEARQLALVPGA
jgi:methylated-DNA-[protein]-cysteine S-methyltransferase